MFVLRAQECRTRVSAPGSSPRHLQSDRARMRLPDGYRCRRPLGYRIENRRSTAANSRGAAPHLFEIGWFSDGALAEFPRSSSEGRDQEAGILMTFFSVPSSVPLCLCGSTFFLQDTSRTHA